MCFLAITIQSRATVLDIPLTATKQAYSPTNRFYLSLPKAKKSTDPWSVGMVLTPLGQKKNINAYYNEQRS